MVRVGPYDIVLVPTTSWGKSLAHLGRIDLGFRGRWEQIRKREIKRAKGVCEYCGAKGKALFCHEQWTYTTPTKTQKLSGYKISCRNCNLILRIGRSSVTGQEGAAYAHFVKVTGLPRSDLESAVEKALVLFDQKSMINWRIDLSSEPLARGFENAVQNLPFDL